MIDLERFYKEVKVNGLFTSLTQRQVQGMGHILQEFERSEYSADIRLLAYMLATVYHECDTTMIPIEEYGKGKGRPYGKKLKMTVIAGKREAYSVPNYIYYGRGYVQLTWYENYDKAGKRLGIDLLGNPKLALDGDIAAKILIHGMMEGWFTGRKLSQFINIDRCDYLNARRVIYGIDCAKLIQGYANKFEHSIHFVGL